MPYKVTVEGQSFLTDDLTLDEAIAIEEATGVPWTRINPIDSGDHCKRIMTTFLARTRSAEEAAKIVGGLTLRQVLAQVVWVDEDLPDEYEDGLPKAAAGPATA